MSDQTPPEPNNPTGATPYGSPPPPPASNPYAAPPPGSAPPPPPAASPPPPPGYPAPTYAAPTPRAGGNGLAITALVFSIIAGLLCWFPFLGVLLALVGLVLGAIAWNKANANAQPKGMAVAATIISILAFLIGLAVTVLVIWFGVTFWDDIVDCADSSLTEQQQRNCVENRIGDGVSTNA